jgi:hypothetical protein
LIISQNANITSKNNMGSHTIQVIEDAQDIVPPNNPAS